nr:sigma-54 dependent transcriptional regulator [Desulfatibacillum aliphaticivorans]
MSNLKILVVEASKLVFDQVRRIYSGQPTEIFLAKSLGHAFEQFEEMTFDILIISGSALRRNIDHSIDLLETISNNCSITQIIILAEKKDLTAASSALRTGSCQYSRLPIDDKELKMLIDAAEHNRPEFGMNLLLKDDLKKVSFHDMVGASGLMKEVFRQIRQAAMSDIPVLISGETGTGKDLVANAIHQISARQEYPFIPIHLGSLPSELVSSELFGHEKGAFTGAWKRHKGSFEKAKKGTVFLDEVGTIDQKNQVALLRVLETQSFNRIGGTVNIKTNVRVVAATNENLAAAVAKKKFREDLFYRLDVFSITIPPVRKRPGDISLLVDYYLRRFNDAYQKNIMGLSPQCISIMEAYEWPGNVREIKNIIHRAVVLCDEKVLLPKHLPKRLLEGSGNSHPVDIRVGDSIEEAEYKLIVETLNVAMNNKSRAAKMLGISRRALYNKLEKHNLML